MRLIAKKILPLFSAPELKEIAKQSGIRGYSKYKKDDLVDFILVSIDDESLENIMKNEGSRKLSTTLDNALLLLKGKSIAGEKISILDASETKITGSFMGLYWNTKFHAIIKEMCDPAFKFSCDCRNALGGGLCVHYWCAFMLLVARGRSLVSCTGSLGALFSRVMKEKLDNSRIPVGNSMQDRLDSIKNTPLDELVKEMTMGSRFENAIVEIGYKSPGTPGGLGGAGGGDAGAGGGDAGAGGGDAGAGGGDAGGIVEKAGSNAGGARVKPAGKKGRKPQKNPGKMSPEDRAIQKAMEKKVEAAIRLAVEREVKKAVKSLKQTPSIRVVVVIEEIVEHPSARLFAGFTRTEAGSTKTMDMHVVIDEAKKIIAHDNCKDFQFRMARAKKFCKHLVEVFMSVKESFARRILCQVDDYKFVTVIPQDLDIQKQLEDDVLEIVPADKLSDMGELKDQMLFSLMNADGGVSVDDLTGEFGENARRIIEIMVSEGIVSRGIDGRYKAR
ncbi:MAG: Rho termination factor N-terminal domain-containing protein [Promethearchaeota archaeon]